MATYEMEDRQVLILETGEVEDKVSGESPAKSYAWVGWNYLRTPHSVLFQERAEICKSLLAWDDTTIASIDDEKFTSTYFDVPFDGVFVIRTAVEEGGYTYYKFEFLSEEENPPDEKLTFKITFKFAPMTSS